MAKKKKRHAEYMWDITNYDNKYGDTTLWYKVLQHVYHNCYNVTITTVDNRIITGIIDGYDNKIIYITTNTDTNRTVTVVKRKCISTLSYTGDNLFAGDRGVSTN